MLKWLMQLAVTATLIVASVALGRMMGDSLRDATGASAAAVSLIDWSDSASTRALLCLTAIAAIAIILAVRRHPLLALFLCGLGAVAAAASMGSASDAIRAEASSAMLIVESLSWAVVIVLVATIMHGVARSDPVHTEGNGGMVRSVVTAVMLTVVSAAVIWVFARSEMKGQVIASASAAGLLCGLVASITHAPRAMKWTYAIPCVAIAAGQVVALLLNGPPDLNHLGEGISAVFLPMPQDAAAGSLFGVTIGLAWGRTLTSEHAHELPQAA